MAFTVYDCFSDVLTSAIGMVVVIVSVYWPFGLGCHRSPKRCMPISVAVKYNK